MLNKNLLEKIYDAAFIQRWNDHAKPFEIYELDKQAHKAVISYFLAKIEETERSVEIDWIYLIEGCIFEFFQRIVLTDIKPPVYHRMMKDKGDELNKWVIKQYEGLIEEINQNFKNKFESYLLDFDQKHKKEKKIIRAAHYLATNWEFKLIYELNPSFYGIEKTKEEIENQIEDHYDLLGVQRILLGKKSYGFIDLCGQLRFQKRWSQSPRIPRTSVLGHMFIVAILSYFCSIKIESCKKRIYNNFYAGLFHDLPEVLTRDIITPVKRSIEGLEQIIMKYEKLQTEEKLLPLLPVSWHDEIKYFIENEFDNKIQKSGIIVKSKSIKEINDKYNYDRFNPLDGEIIKVCDDLAAFLEAYISITSGITSQHLKDGIHDLYEKYQSYVLCNINIGDIFNHFKSKIK